MIGRNAFHFRGEFTKIWLFRPKPFPMNRFSTFVRWRIPISLLLLLAALLYWVLYSRRTFHVFQAIPPQTAVAAVFQGRSSVQRLELGAGRPSQGGLADLQLMQVCQQDMDAAFSVFQADEAIRNAYNQNLLIAAASLQPADSLHALFALDAGGDVNLAAFLEKQADGYKYFPARFKGHTLYTLYLSRTERLVVASVRNLLLFSRFSYLVEDALLQTGNRGQWWMKRAYAAGDQPTAPPVQVLVRTETLAQRCAGSMAPLWKQLPEWLTKQVEWLDFYWEGNSWYLNAGPNMPSRQFQQAPALSDEVYTILPNNTALLGRISLSSTADLEPWLAGASDDSEYRRYIGPWLGNELDFVLLEPFSPGMLEDQYWVLAMADSSLARQKLEAYGRESGLVKAYDYQTFEIKQFLDQSLLSPLLGNVTAFVFRNPVYTIIDNFVVFASTPSAMELWVDKYIVSQTMATNTEFLQLNQKFPGKGSAAILLQAARAPALLKNIFSPEQYARLNDDLKKMPQLGLLRLDVQKITDHGALHASLVSAHLENTPSETSILWKAALTGNAITQPYLVYKKDPGSEAAILIQDDQLQLYRLTETGVVLWRKQLDLPILSAIHGVDFFNNGTNCYVFNTADAIWVLDDQGKEMVGYPLKLQSLATNGVTVIDFDNNHKYHFFLACSNGNLYGFDQFGRPLPGWNPQTGVGRVKHPLIHFKHDTKDYLAVLNLNGQLYVFNRNGTSHFAPVQLEGTFFVNPPQFDANSAAPRIVCMNTAGRTFICNLSGQVFSLQLAAHQRKESTLVFQNLGGDSRYDYAVLTGESLSLSGYAGNSFRKWSALMMPSRADTLFAAGCCEALGALNRKKRQIFLIDSQGKMHPDFPLAGTTPFVMKQAISSHTENILLVGNENSVYAYKIR